MPDQRLRSSPVCHLPISGSIVASASDVQ